MSLQRRLTLRMASFISGLVLALALSFAISIEWIMLGQLDAQLEARASALTAPDQPSSADAPLGHPIRALLVAEDSLAAAEAPFELAGLLSAEDTGPRSVAGPGGATQFRVLIQPLPAGAGQRQWLVIHTSLEPLRQTLAELRAALLLVAGGAWLLGLLGAWVLSHKTVTPLATLIRSAADIVRTGQYQERLQLPQGASEAGPLASVLNDLITTVEQNLERQRQFLANTSHELRSPLTAILANLNLLQRNLDPEERAISLKEAMIEAQRMRRLVNDLLLLARSDSAQMIERHPVRLDLLIERGITSMQRQVTTHRIDWEPPPPVTVLGDEERLIQLLRNLLENGIQHTPPGSVITVRLACAANATLTVQDNGPGISPEHLAQIWDRFYQANRARSRAAGGSGLGLPIVKYIAEAHGGAVELETRVGGGTTFRVTLPVADGEDAQDQR